MAVTLRESFTPVPPNGSNYQGTIGRHKCQSFTAVSTHPIDRIDLRFRKTFGAPSITYTVYLYAESNNLPIGSPLATFGSFNLDDLTYNYTTLSFDSDSYTVTSGNEYVIVVSTTFTVPPTTTTWLIWYTGTGYSKGVSGYFVYPDWVEHTGYDRWFACYEDSSSVVYAEGTKTVSAAATVDYITGPGKAWNPSPTDNQENIAIIGRTRINTLTWNAPTGETPDYLVYFRASGDSWALQETITDDSTSHALSASVRNSLAYYSTYEWRVDTRDVIGGETLTTTGDTWTFVSQSEGDWTNFDRPSDYDPDKPWEPGTGWVDIDSFEYTGGGRFKGRVLVIGHKVIYFGDL
jgi:hypothetical protein